MTYLGHHVTLTWGQILTLTFQGHAIHVSMRIDEANTMVSKSLLYHFKHGSYHRKTVSLKNAVFDLSWPLTPKPLVLGEIWRHRSERAFQELSIAFLNFDVAVTGTEIMRIIWSYIPAPCWASGFPTACWGGGAFERPPPWSRLLVAVKKNERQRSKAREKSFRNHFGHFLAQVKIGVSRGQNSKIFQNGFSTIKSLILKIEQLIWYHRVCLVKARRTIYKITLKGQGQSLTSGQVRPRSRDDRNGSYCISVDSPGQDERTDTNPTSLSLFDQKLLVNDGWWPRVTSNDLWRGR